MTPIVSVLIANHNGSAFVSDALASCAKQSIQNIEIVFVDDCSTDDSPRIAERFARTDSRLRVVRLARRSGPGGARNAALDLARGIWVCILDSDDIMHPERLEQLLAEAERSRADLCADNQLIFGDDIKCRPFLSEPETAPRWITSAEYIRANRLLSSKPALGYLKPLINRAVLQENLIRYNPVLRIGEDYDLIVRLLLRGARYRLVDSMGYFYRRHPASTSHRISAGELERLLLADDALAPLFQTASADIREARKERRSSIVCALAYARIVAALKAGDLLQAVKNAAQHPMALLELREPIAVRLKQLIPKRSHIYREGARGLVCVVSRQRITGSTSGNSSYLLSLCQALHDRGYRVTLILPSPAIFGRWPYLRLDRDLAMFAEIFIRGSWKATRHLYVARDPRILFAAGLTIVEDLLLRARLIRHRRVKPAPFAIAVPWTRDDQVFIAQHAPRGASLIIADYAFLTPGIPFALCPAASSLVVMHDLFSARTGQFKRAGVADTVASLDEETEIALLNKADAIVAIQANEGALVSERLPGRRVIVAPMAVTAVSQPQPGDSRTILFVGTSTAPNVIGLRWFLADVWSSVRQAIPDCELLVAGSVCRAISGAPPGVSFLGFVPVLEPLYRKAGVVISPLTLGSGLKIKLIEALGQGKAIVATTVTVEGVDNAIGEAVSIADEATSFSDAVRRLLQDSELRTRQGQRALDYAKRRFSREACYADFLAYVEQQSGRAGFASPDALDKSVSDR